MSTTPTPAPVPPVAAKPAVSPVAPKPAPVKVPSPYANKIVKDIRTLHTASVFVVDLSFTDDSHYFIKTKQGVLELGGTSDWDTGAKA
jgi:hypothetical protein